MDNLYADLHIHSIYSDSDLTIENIFSKAKSKGINSIAITDHDTTAGISNALSISQEYDIELLEGIEIGSEMGDFEIHILGYLIDHKNSYLNNILEEIRQTRRERIIKMISNLNKLGLKLDKDYLWEEIIKEAAPTRLHIALYMVEKEYVPTVWDAFKHYLSYGKSAYVSREHISVKKAIKIIKEAQGLPFLAHPHFIPNQFREDWVKKFVQWGLEGIEVLYPRYTKHTTETFKTIAAKFGLLLSGGSDSHGSYKDYTSLGEVKIPYTWVEEIKKRKAEIDR